MFVYKSKNKFLSAIKNNILNHNFQLFFASCEKYNLQSINLS